MEHIIICVCVCGGGGVCVCLGGMCGVCVGVCLCVFFFDCQIVYHITQLLTSDSILTQFI